MFRQISELRDRLTQEKQYLEEEINLERRFGLDTAVQAVAAVRVGQLIDVSKVIGVGVLGRTPPLPAPPQATETSIELPWRLTVSPNAMYHLESKPAQT